MTTSIHGFVLERDEEIPEYRTRARLFRHARTGAELLSLENDDENKCFGIAFRTPTHDSTGVPHILEHAVLNGSRKFPVKEPFNELSKGSLKTFLNAITFRDRTVYPIASTNLQDFYNLADVYLDAVFHPRITREVFEQEGWRYEPEQFDKDGADLVYKGVVLNEMRGAMASPDRELYEVTQRALFPDTLYRHSSGGEPDQIPTLTYEQFRAFHATYYHPSNARIFFYGDADPERSLKLVDDYLREFDPLDVDADVPLQPRFPEPTRVTATYAVGPETKDQNKARLTVNWLLDEVPPPDRSLALGVLGHILTGTPASPLRKALIDSGLGEALAGGGLGSGLRQWTFSTGLRGIVPDAADQVEGLVLRTLRELAEDGIDRDMVEASLNTVEFSLRENNTGQFPRGLSLFFRALGTWAYGRDPLEQLKFESPLAALKERVASGERVFESLIRDALLDNTHRVTVLLLPDPDLGARREAAEKERLERELGSLTKEERAALVARAAELKRLQETPDPPEALATVPRLRLGDLDREHKPIPIQVSDSGGARVLFHDLVTNGVVYLNVGFDLRRLPEDLLPYVPLFGRALRETGTRTEDFVTFSRRIGRTTGGVWTSTITSAHLATREPVTWLLLCGKALVGQTPELLDILHEALLEARLDNQARIKQLVRESKAQLESRIPNSGNVYAQTRLLSRLNQASWVNEQLYGVSQLLFLRQLAGLAESDFPTVQAALERLRDALVSRTGALCNVTADADGWRHVAPHVESFLASLPDRAAPSAPAAAGADRSRPRPGKSEGMVIPGQINFVAKGANLYDLGYSYHGSAEVVVHHVRRGWLHDRLRVRGGAYGAGCGFSRRSGTFSYWSYRDPNVVRTLDAYDETVSHLRQTELTDDEVEKAIIGTVSSVDEYLLPDAKGWRSMERYLLGESDDWLQRVREEILGTTAADFKRFADALEPVAQHGDVVVVGNQTAIDAARAERPGVLEDVWHLGL